METWRVVGDAGEVHEASVIREDDGVWCAKFTAEPSWPNGFGFNARTALLRACAIAAVGAVEIVAPGAMTAAEKVDAERERCATVCRDIARAYLNDINGAEFPRHSGAYSVADGCANAIRSGE